MPCFHSMSVRNVSTTKGSRSLLASLAGESVRLMKPFEEKGGRDLPYRKYRSLQLQQQMQIMNQGAATLQRTPQVFPQWSGEFALGTSNERLQDRRTSPIQVKNIPFRWNMRELPELSDTASAGKALRNIFETQLLER